MSKLQKAKELTGSILQAQVPLWLALSMSLGAAVLGVVAGPPLVAIFNAQKAAELVGTHCDAALSKQALDCEKQLSAKNADFVAKLDQLRGEHSREIEAMRLKLDEQGRKIAEQERVIISLRKDVCALIASLDGRPVTGCLE